MTDFTDLKVPVFSGINDLPVAPTASKAGNGSHLIATINNVIDKLSQQNGQTTTSNSNNWNIINTGSEETYNASLQINTKNILMLGNQEYAAINLTLPLTQTIGSYVTLLKLDPTLDCRLQVYDQIRRHRLENARLDLINEEVTLIFMGDEGWDITRSNVLTFTEVTD